MAPSRQSGRPVSSNSTIMAFAMLATAVAWLRSPGPAAARTDSNRATARRTRSASPTSVPLLTSRDPTSVHAASSTGTASPDRPGNMARTLAKIWSVTVQ
jgi:hypothetical protein